MCVSLCVVCTSLCEVYSVCMPDLCSMYCVSVCSCSAVHFTHTFCCTLIHAHLHLPPVDVEEEGQGNDWLYVVMTDIVSNHNQTIENLYSSIQTHPLARLLPDEPPKIYPTEVNANTAIVSQFVE